MTYLIGVENGKKMKTTMAIRYLDTYIFENNKWLISKRTSYFDWTEKVPFNE